MYARSPANHPSGKLAGPGKKQMGSAPATHNDTGDPSLLQPPSGHCLEPYGWVSAECDHGSRIHVPMTCGRCGPCLERRAWTHRCRIHYAVGRDGPASMLTLTSRPGTTWPQIMRAWQSLVRTLRRDAPSLEYVCVKEFGPDRHMKHLHIITLHPSYIPQATLSQLWSKYLGAPIVWITHVDPARGATELAKYLTKPPPRGLRTITYSREFPEQEFPHNFHFRGRRTDIPDDMALTATLACGILVETVAPGCTCLPDCPPITPGERAWLALLSRPSRAPPPDESEALSSATPDSGPSRSQRPLLWSTPHPPQ